MDFSSSFLEAISCDSVGAWCKLFSIGQALSRAPTQFAHLVSSNAMAPSVQKTRKVVLNLRQYLNVNQVLVQRCNILQLVNGHSENWTCISQLQKMGYLKQRMAADWLLQPSR